MTIKAMPVHCTNVQCYGVYSISHMTNIHFIRESIMYKMFESENSCNANSENEIVYFIERFLTI